MFSFWAKWAKLEKLLKGEGPCRFYRRCKSHAIKITWSRTFDLFVSRGEGGRKKYCTWFCFSRLATSTKGAKIWSEKSQCDKRNVRPTRQNLLIAQIRERWNWNVYANRNFITSWKCDSCFVKNALVKRWIRLISINFWRHRFLHRCLSIFLDWQLTLRVKLGFSISFCVDCDFP